MDGQGIDRLLGRGVPGGAQPHVGVQLTGPDGQVEALPWEAALVRVLSSIDANLHRIAEALDRPTVLET